MSAAQSSAVPFNYGSRRDSSAAAGALRLLCKIIGISATVLMILIVVAPLLHIGFSPVLTGSMRPAFAPGDLLITAPADVASLRPGQIAVFTPPGESVPFAHRIMAIAGTPQQPILSTKGDANPAQDTWHTTVSAGHATVVVTSIPSLGTALLWIQQPIQRAVLIGLVGLMATGAVAAWFIRNRRRAVQRATDFMPLSAH
ncbi:signal peptidase I [Arthrobacter sp. 2MCAF14]|uniref:signal peptidase I n=1 Tax=Arthrobacter sp. 2MCAF14 TaxID=3232982 RepID=UPI003F91B261